MAQPGHLPTLAHNALPGAPAAVNGVPVLTTQTAQHAELMQMAAEHRQWQEEELWQMVMRLHAAAQRQGGQVVSPEGAAAQRRGGQVVSPDVLGAQELGPQHFGAGQPAVPQQRLPMLQGCTEVFVLCIPLVPLCRTSMPPRRVPPSSCLAPFSE